jgi:LmbE family N-acetylglucosaminyl deacetylase|tara:strand:- start:3409 stop:4068 length:660 start_codon:yes stop_codon:yes gene_type:complete
LKVLIIGAHADDPEVSMGGTISKLVRAGHQAKLLTCILPEEDRAGNKVPGAKPSREMYQKNAAKKLGCSVDILNMDPYSFCLNRELVKLIDKSIVDFEPDLIFTHWYHDSHQDHKAVSNATFAAARKNKTTVLMYEQLTLGGITPGSFNSHVYLDISDTIEEKISAVRCYEFIEDKDLDAILSLARFRGNQIGVKYAECFEVCKVIAKIDSGGFTIGGC